MRRPEAVAIPRWKDYNLLVVYTPRLQKAIDSAIKAHLGQTRKGKQVPYILHPLTVGLILSKVGAEEDVIVAGILHDTIEDTDMTYEDIEKEFGENVAKVVNDVTEQDKSLPWVERKRLALEHIKEMMHDSLLVKSADVLHNMTDLIRDYEEEGEKVFKRFNAPREHQIERYKNLIRELRTSWPKNPLLPDLKGNLKKLLSLS